MFSSYYKLTSHDIFYVIKTELNIKNKFEEISAWTFKELGVQLFEVNLILNKVEWIFKLTIKDAGISLQTKLKEFIDIILLQLYVNN